MLIALDSNQTNAILRLDIIGINWYLLQENYLLCYLGNRRPVTDCFFVIYLSLGLCHLTLNIISATSTYNYNSPFRSVQCQVAPNSLCGIHGIGLQFILSKPKR